jgi:hypothetical protein
MTAATLALFFLSSSVRLPYEFDFLLRHDPLAALFQSFYTFLLKAHITLTVHFPLELVEALLHPLNHITALFHRFLELEGFRIIGTGLGTIL